MSTDGTPHALEIVDRAALDRELEHDTWLRTLVCVLAERFAAVDAELTTVKSLRPTRGLPSDAHRPLSAVRRAVSRPPIAA